MTPEQFLLHVRKERLAPAYLFLGPEPYQRDQARKALLERALRAEEREDGLARHDLEETTLAAVLDDARSLALFAPNRLILVSRAEGALPRTRSRQAEPEAAGETPRDAAAAALSAYLASPSPGVVLLFEAARYDFEGEDKAKIERVRKLYSAIPVQVEFPRLTTQSAQALARQLLREARVSVDRSLVELLVEALGADGARIAAEVEKLRLYAGEGRQITAEDIGRLVPDARASTIFALVAALGRGDRPRALDVLDTLIRQGEYLPLALTFLGTQFRLALVAREAGLNSPQQIQAHFSRRGTPMWRSRAEQVCQTVTAFSPDQLQAALKTIFETDKHLRDARPDDRVVMENLIFRLT
jgi:DNA polymerase-3 subunit delta